MLSDTNEPISQTDDAPLSIQDVLNMMFVYIKKVEEKANLNMVCFQRMAKVVDEILDVVEPGMKPETVEEFKATLASKMKFAQAQAEVDAACDTINKIAEGTKP